MKTEDEMAKILELWIIRFDNADGTKNMDLCNSHLILPKFINKIRSMGGKNIVITDETIFFIDDKEDE